MRLGSKNGWLAAVVVLLLSSAAIPTLAQSQGQGGPTAAMDDEWHFTFAPYMWFSGIKGELSVANLPSVPVDAPISDILSNFDIGLEGHFEARKNRFGLAFDFIWSDLGVPVAPDAELLDFTVDVRQLFTEGWAFYRVASGGRSDNPAHLDVLAGMRYTATKTRLTAETGTGDELAGEFVELSWVDALAGLKFRAPLGSKAAILGRADIAGFGSKLTWNLEGDLAFRASEHWTLGAGWRYMDIEYEEGEGIAFRQFDLAYNGPRAWFAYSW
jgi:hypothetical protein